MFIGLGRLPTIRYAPVFDENPIPLENRIRERKLYFLSFFFRDPNNIRTLEAFDQAVEWASQGKFKDEDIEEAKLSVFSSVQLSIFLQICYIPCLLINSGRHACLLVFKMWNTNFVRWREPTYKKWSIARDKSTNNLARIIFEWFCFRLTYFS